MDLEKYDLLDSGYVEKFVGLDYVKDKVKAKYGPDAIVKRVKTDTKGLIIYEVWLPLEQTR